MEQQRLKAMYTHSRLELNGEYLFVPIVSNDGGHCSFKWNAQNANDYYGYDLGESSGHLHAGVTWTQPLLGNSQYRAAREQERIKAAVARNDISMETHQLERTVTEQYVLCLLDKARIGIADSVERLLDYQEAVVGKLVNSGFSKQSSLTLLAAERKANDEQRVADLQSYHSHLMDLNLICGISDTLDVDLAYVDALPTDGHGGGQSLFMEQYRLDSLDAEASLRSFNMQYKPKLNLFVDGGMQTGAFKDFYRHFGWSAGLTFSWTLYDGKQQRWQQRQTEIRKNTVSSYRENMDLQRRMRIRQCISEMSKYDERRKLTERRLADYDKVLADYGKEIRAGQVSVLDYITVLKSKISAEKDLLLLDTNRQLAVVAYNYWNW